MPRESAAKLSSVSSMEAASPRQWWHLEPNTPAELPPTEISPELIKYYRSHYRDGAALDAMMSSPLAVVQRRAPAQPDPAASEHPVHAVG